MVNILGGIAIMKRQVLEYLREKCFSWVVLFLLTVLLSACGGGGGEQPGSGTPLMIGPSGGSKTSSDGRASVSIPAGALSQDSVISVTVASSSVSGNIGPVYDFGPSGTTFNQPVTISISYDESALPSGVTESDLRLGTVNNNRWEMVTGATVDTAANVVHGTATHFSTYGVIAVTSGVAPLVPTGLTVAAAEGQVTLTWNSVADATSYNLYLASQ